MSPSEFVVVETENGPVRGVKKSTILGMNFINFQGIPYMKAPIGKLRFRDAQQPEKFIEPFDASRELSFPMFDYFGNKFKGQEDAGVINVFTKDASIDRKFPVMVWIHGGGFQTGSSKTDFYGPDYLLQKDIVLVSFNYRCGAFGFLSFDDPKIGVPGNTGLKDQTLALKWVQKNIANFGGDPKNVTIFGESAGGASVHYHMISNHSRDLFQRAIPMSGVAFNNGWTLQPRRNWAFRLATVLGYNGSQTELEILEFLENVDALKIVEVSQEILTLKERHGEKIIVPFGPQIEPYQSENCFIPKDPLLMAREAWSNESVDCLIGGVSNEGLIMGYWFGVAKDYSLLKILEDSKYFAPLLETGFSADDPRSIEFGKILKQAYYGCTQPSKSNIEGYFYFAGDYFFWHGIQRAALLRASAAKAKTFLYRFDILTKLNYFKSFSKSEDYPGTEHGADFCYLFKGTFMPPPAIESIEFENVKKTVEIFTNFAINGNPNCDWFSDEWKALKSTELPLKAMNIGTDKCEFIDLPETERLSVWNKIFEDAGLDLY